MHTIPDVTVVGAGVIGCAVAYELGRRGASVLVVERRGVGQGATQASAGMLAPFIEAQHPGPMRALGVRSLELYDAFVADVTGDSRAEVPYDRSGTIEVATEAASMTALETAATRLREDGVEHRLLGPDEAREAEPHLAAGVLGGLLLPSQGFVAAAALTGALREAAARHGVTFRTGATAAAVKAADRGVELEVDGAPVRTGTVVMAAGSWSGRLDLGAGGSVPVRPVRGQLVRLVWRGTPLTRVVFAPRCYVVPWRDGVVLVGATVEEAGFDEGATVDGVAGLLDAVVALLPAARTAGFEGVRVGLRPSTPDALPVLGRWPAAPNVVFATGHYRNGVLLAPITARLIADLVLDGREDRLLRSFAPTRFWSA